MSVYDEHPDAYLIETDWTFRFGPLDAPLLVLNAVDESDGSMWSCSEPVGWSATDAVTPLDPRQRGDGAYAGETTFAARTLSFGSGEPGLTVCPDRRTAVLAMRRLRQIAQTREPILYTQEDYPPQSLYLRATGRPNLRWVEGSDVAFEWSFVMVADDPFRFDAAQLAEELSTQLPGPAAGFVYPIVYPLIYPGGSSTGSILVENAGDEASPAVYTLTGPVTSPTVQNVTTGVGFTIDRTLAATDEVVVDTRTATVTLNGGSIYGSMRGEFPSIRPGDNLVQWAGTAVGDVLLPVAPVPVWTESRRNRVPNPQPNSSTSWFGNAGTGGTVTPTAPTTGGPSGGPFYRQTYTVGNTSAAGTSPAASIVADGRASAPLPIPVVAGTVYSAAIQVRSSIAQRLVAVLRWYDAAGAAVGTAATGTQVVVAAGAWTALSAVNATAPAGAVFCRIEAATTAGAGVVPFPAGATFDAALAQLEVGSPLGAYFDGTTAAEPIAEGSRRYSWTGTAHASASIEERATLTYPPAPNAGATLSVVTTSTWK